MAGIVLTLAGRIGKNASVKAFENGAVVNATLAVEDDLVTREGDKFTHKKSVIWFNVQIGGYHNLDSAAKVARYLGKGAIVTLTGNLQHTPEGYPRLYKRADQSVGSSFDIKCLAGDMTLLKGVDVTAVAEPQGEPPASEDF